MPVVLGLAITGMLLFGGSINDPFHFDDALILKDSNITNTAGTLHFFNPLYLRQLTFFTFHLNYLAGGSDPAGYHLFNVAVHIANSLLLLMLLTRFFDRWIALLASTLFLVHPIQTEAVLYVYQRSVLLACFFSLAGLLALTAHRRVLALLLFFLAFESKESALAVPLGVAVFYGSWKKSVADNVAGFLSLRFRTALAFGAVVLAATALLMLAYREESTVGFGAASEVGPFRYFLVQTRVVFTYLRLLFVPYPQSLEYEFTPTTALLPLAGLLALIALAWRLARSAAWHVAGFCILIFFALLAPTSSFVPSKDFAFEHRLYLPMLSFSLLAAWLLSRIRYRTWIASAIVAVLCFLTLLRGQVWSSEIALWEDTSRRAPGKARVWFNLGGAYLEPEPERARQAMRRALELEPDFVEAIYNLGLIEQRNNRWHEAMAFYEQATQKDPSFWPAWNNMGNTVFSMGYRDAALRYFEKTLSLNPDYWPAQYNVAVIHFIGGRYVEAVRRLRIVLDWSPDFKDARYLLAQSAARTGNHAAAAEEMKKLGITTAPELSTFPPMILAPNRP